MPTDTEYTVFDMIQEAAVDVLNPMIDQEVLTCSQMDVVELARRIVRRTGELMDATDGVDTGTKIDLTTPVRKRA